MTLEGTGTRVVVADDDADIRALVAIAVRKADLELVGSVEDGVAAIEAIRMLLPQLVVLDVSMPGKTGLELCRIIRADETLNDMRIMLLSAGATDASRQAGLDAGADEYFVKPFSPRELATRLAELAALAREGV